MDVASNLRVAVTAAGMMVLCASGASAFDWPWSNKAAGVPPASSLPAYADTSLPAEQRVDDLIGRLTLEEKATQLVNQARPIPRLGIPGYNWWNEALHGVARNGLATVFPQAIALGATFDPALAHDEGVAISTEARVKFNRVGYEKDHAIFQGLTFWSPNVNIFRDPRWGRGQETYGEDPWLSGRLGKAFVTGIQGDDPKYLRAIATPKHFAVHSGPESSRHIADIAVSKHDMADTYLPQFREAVVNGHAGSVMCAYNRVNGQPACAQDYLLDDILRGTWGFKGVMVSDCDAIEDITYGHHYTKNLAESAALTLKHGVDNDCADYFLVARTAPDYQRYIDAVKQGLVPEAVVDASLRRLFLARMKLGLFDPKGSVPFAQIPDSALDSAEHRALATKTARESIVLLKNKNALPFDAGIRHIAVVGPLADQATPLLGNYNGTPSRITTALEGLRRRFPAAEVSFEPGTDFLRPAVAIPTEALFDGAGKHGLKAEFFTTADFSTAPFLTRTDADVNYQRDVGTADTSLPSKGPVAVRWTGMLTPKETGDYAVGLDARAGRLFLDGKELVNLDGPTQHSATTVTVHLKAGHSYALRIERGLAPYLEIRLVWARKVPDAEKRALATVKKADAVVAVVGITPQLEGEEMIVDVPGFKGGDRQTLDLPKPEEDLLKAVRGATKKPLVVVLYGGSALSVNWVAKKADAVVEAWYGGEEAGTAIADVLSGAYNPAGRLPVTFYAGLKDLPAFEDYSMRGRTYRYYRGKPLYPFGYGLSYTSFSYDGLRLSASTLKAGDRLAVDAKVTNTGRVAGDEVAQLYLTFPDTPGMPRVALRGVQRVHLTPGETKIVHFDLEPRDLSSVTEAGEIKVQPGAYTLSVGGGQPKYTKAIASLPLTITGETTLSP